MDSVSGIIVNRRCYLKRFVNLQKKWGKYKYYEIKLSSRQVKQTKIKQHKRASTKYLLIRGNKAVRARDGGDITVIARREPSLGPFFSADEMWAFTNGSRGLGITKPHLTVLWSGTKHGWLHPLTDAVVCPEDFILWDDSGNNTGFLSRVSGNGLVRFRLGTAKLLPPAESVDFSAASPADPVDFASSVEAVDIAASVESLSSVRPAGCVDFEAVVRASFSWPSFVRLAGIYRSLYTDRNRRLG